jgi:hypothetical protein
MERHYINCIKELKESRKDKLFTLLWEIELFNHKKNVIIGLQNFGSRENIHAWQKHTSTTHTYMQSFLGITEAGKVNPYNVQPSVLYGSVLAARSYWRITLKLTLPRRVPTESCIPESFLHMLQVCLRRQERSKENNMYFSVLWYVRVFESFKYCPKK